MTTTTSSSVSALLSSPGIGSGLDVNSIVSALMGVESQPLTNLQTKETQVKAQLSAYGQLQSAISTFQTAMQAMTFSSQLKANTLTVSDPTILNATAGGSAIPGNSTVEVLTLAQQQKLALSGFANTTDVVGTGTLTIQVGTGTAQTISISSSNNTLAGVRDAINAAGTGVTASIVNDGSTNGNRLVLTANNSGASNTINIGVADDDGTNNDASGLSQLAFSSGTPGQFTQLLAAQDATLKVDGMSITKPSNTITDAIQGVTLNLTKTNVGNPITVGTTQNTSQITTAVTNFVAAFNTINSTIRNLTAYANTTTGASAGTLSGDPTARDMLTQIRNSLTQTISGNNSFSHLSDIGVSIQQDGTLAVDSTKLQTAISSNANDTISLVNSFANSQNQLTTQFLGTNGNLTARTDSFNASIKRMDDQQTAMQARLDQIEARYRAQYTQLDTAISTMKTTSTYLTQQLAALNSNSSGN